METYRWPDVLQELSSVLSSLTLGGPCQAAASATALACTKLRSSAQKVHHVLQSCDLLMRTMPAH